MLEGIRPFSEFFKWQHSPSIHDLLKVFQPSTKIMEIEKINEYYNVTHPKVFTELFRNANLRKFLVEKAYSKIREYFPDAKELTLDYSPESDSGTIMLYIQIKKDPEEAFRTLQKFDEEWWLDKANQFKNLCIHLWLL